MPNKNGTGPEGKGPKTGRGLGSCGNGTARGDGKGKGLGRGIGFRRNVEEKNEDKKEN